MSPAPHPRMHGLTHVKGGPDPIPGLLTAAPIAGDYEGAVLATTDLIAYWRLGEASTPWVDSAGSYDLTLSGSGTAPTPDVAGALGLGDDGAIEFNYDGTSGSGGQYLQYGTTTVFRDLAAKTIAAWVKTKASALTREGGIIGTRADTGGSSQGWALQVLYPARDITFAQGNNSALVTTTGGVLAGQWYHAAVTDDGTETRLYINGAVTDTAAVGGGSGGGHSNIHLGLSARSGATNWFYGSVDEAAVWTRALSATEIATLYTAGVSTSGAGELGELLQSDGAGGTQWLPNGAENQVLTIIGGVPTWVDP